MGHHSPPGSSVHGILQERILEWVAMPCPRYLPNPGTEPTSPVAPALQANSLPPGKPLESLVPGNPLKYSCLENPMDRAAWQTIVHRVTQNWILLKWLSIRADSNRGKKRGFLIMMIGKIMVHLRKGKRSKYHRSWGALWRVGWKKVMSLVWNMLYLKS